MLVDSLVMNTSSTSRQASPETFFSKIGNTDYLSPEKGREGGTVIVEPAQPAPSVTQNRPGIIASFVQSALFSLANSAFFGYPFKKS